jgi:hypothetical protein
MGTGPGLPLPRATDDGTKGFLLRDLDFGLCSHHDAALPSTRAGQSDMEPEVPEASQWRRGLCAIFRRPRKMGQPYRGGAKGRQDPAYSADGFFNVFNNSPIFHAGITPAIPLFDWTNDLS